MRKLLFFNSLLLIFLLSRPLPLFSTEIDSSHTLTIIAVGDIMMGTDFPKDKLPPNNGSSLLSEVAPILRGGDLTFGNLEGVLLDGGEPEKTCNDTSLCYLFRTPSSYVEHLKNAGFDVLSLANNHARDFGEAGRTATMQTLSNAGIQHAGRLGDIATGVIDSVRWALIAFAPNPGSYSNLDQNRAVREIKKLDQTYDLVLVSVHGGAEGENAIHVVDSMEVYYGEERGNMVEFAHAVIDAGADLVLGHGPHVPRALELYRDRLIAYSLGNFCTYRGVNIAGINGYAPILVVTLHTSGAFVTGNIISARQYRPQGTRLDAHHRAAKLVQQLTLEDFPQTAISIDDQGLISRKKAK